MPRIWKIAIVVTAVIIAILLFARQRELPPPSESLESPKLDPALQSTGVPFRGPVGAPFIVGPKEPPPR